MDKTYKVTGVSRVHWACNCPMCSSIHFHEKPLEAYIYNTTRARVVAQFQNKVGQTVTYHHIVIKEFDVTF